MIKIKDKVKNKYTDTEDIILLANLNIGEIFSPINPFESIEGDVHIDMGYYIKLEDAFGYLSDNEMKDSILCLNLDNDYAPGAFRIDLLPRNTMVRLRKGKLTIC